ncbi:MAG: hypothetical protein ACE5IJ_12080, partial [Thermoplasmata archaeon]
VETTQSGIARAIQATRTGVIRAIKTLIRDGLIEEKKRHPEPDGVKRWTYTLTERGWDAAREISRRVRGVFPEKVPVELGFEEAGEKKYEIRYLTPEQFKVILRAHEEGNLPGVFSVSQALTGEPRLRDFIPIYKGRDPEEVLEDMENVWTSPEGIKTPEEFYWSGYLTPPMREPFIEAMKKVPGVRGIWTKDGRYVVARTDI